MELKDLILQTISEIDKPESSTNTSQSQADDVLLDAQDKHTATEVYSTDSQNVWVREECDFLELLQERLVVLFEGLNTPHNDNQQVQLQITINFLEYVLNVIQERLALLKS